MKPLITPRPASAWALVVADIYTGGVPNEAFTSQARVTHLAMWSGPRNISTAMMRSFGNRPNTKVIDEPFYAHYLLNRSNIAHPGRDEVIGHNQTDPQKVAAVLIAPLAGGIELYYQKHMCQHMIAGVPIDWIHRVSNVFLIRDPRDVVRSWTKVVKDISLDELGLPKQVELFRKVKTETGQTPAVIDSNDVLADPETVLRKLCERIGLEFTDRMLHWEPGPREYDGNWAPYWYANVYQSTGFDRRTAKTEPVDPRFEPLIEQAQALYNELAQYRIC